MLLRYVVSNYKSIGHPIEFTMLPDKDNTDERFLTTIATKAGEWKVLCRSGFFGANASGKTSFIDSINFSSNYIVEGRKSGRGTDVIQFKGNIEELHGLSTFQFIFFQDGEVYDYGFSLNKRQVSEEWLMQLTKKGFKPVFTRTTDEKGLTRIDITSKLARANSKARNLAELLKESIQQGQRNQLYLSKLRENGISKAERIVEWFYNIKIIFPGSQYRALPIKMQANKDLEKFIGNTLHILDTGVLSAYPESINVDFEQYAEKIDLPKDFADAITEAKSGIFLLNNKCFLFSGGENGKTTLIQLRLKHILNDKEIKFDIDEESDGTRRLLNLLPMLFMTGKDSSIFFVDEIDRSLHTKLSQYLLSDFAKRAQNGQNQIIFTAHDVNLINLNYFRQDEIWFIDKNKTGESRLKPLSDFSLNENTDAIKDYLSGRFGAIPVIGRNE